MISKNIEAFGEDKLISLGKEYFDKKEYNTALELFKQCIVEYPESSNVYLWLGITYSEMGNKEKAIECYKKIVELDPNNESATIELNKIQK